MKSVNVRFTLTLVFGLLLSNVLYATDLRGRVDKVSKLNGSSYPAGSVKVTLNRENNGRWEAINETYTAADGFYYFYGVVVGGSNQFRITAGGPGNFVEVSIPPDRPAFDIPVVKIR